MVASAQRRSVRAASPASQEPPRAAAKFQGVALGVAVTQWRCRRCKGRILDYQLMVAQVPVGVVVKLRHKCDDCHAWNVLTLPHPPG